MITTLLRGIIDQLNQYLRATNSDIGSTDDDPALLENVANVIVEGNENVSLQNRVIATVVNIAEEGSMKNKPNNRLISGQQIKKHPRVHINLFILFAVNHDMYTTALDRLFGVVEFFQSSKIFNLTNVPLPSLTEEDGQRLVDIELVFELHTLSFEQLNDLWGSLGGKQMPFVLYQVRLIPVEMQSAQVREGIITEIDFSSLHL